MKTLTAIKIFCTGAISFTAYLFGGLDVLISCLLTMVVIDYITGIVAAWINKELSSHIGFVGIIKKVCIFLVVMAAQCISLITDVEGIRNVTVSFYIANEGISILENLGRIGVPLPKKLVDVLKQIKEGEL